MWKNFLRFADTVENNYFYGIPTQNPHRLMLTLTLTKSESLRLRTQKRDAAIKARFNTLYETRVEGMKLSLDSIIAKIADEFFISVKTTETILRKNESPD